MSTQPVEDALNDEQRRIRQQGPNGEQRKILEDTMNNPTSALKDADSFVEGVLAYQMRVDYKKRAWALRDGCGAGAGAGRNSSELAEHLVLSDELGKRDKNFLRVFEQVSPVTVRHWFQQMVSVDHGLTLSSGTESDPNSRRSSTIVQPTPITPSNKRPRPEPDLTHKSNSKHITGELKKCILFENCNRCGHEGYSRWKWFLKHFLETHLTSLQTAHAHAGSAQGPTGARRYLCRGVPFATAEALARHAWDNYMVPIQTANPTQASQALLTAQSTPLVSRVSTPVPPAPQTWVNPPICGPNRAGYAPTSVSGSSSAQANGYQAPLTLDNMPSNTLSFEQSFQFRTDEVGMPLPLQNGNPTSYQDYTDPWNARTQ